MRSAWVWACALLAALAFAAGTSAASTVFAIDPAPYAVGQLNRIAVGPDGFPVVSYITGDDPQGGGNLRITKCGSVDCSTGNASTTITANAGVVSNLGLVVPDDGRPLLAYIQYDGVSLNVRVTRCGNAACTTGNVTQTLPGSSHPNKYLGGMVVGHDATPVVAYILPTDAVRIVKCHDVTCSSSSAVDTPLAGAGLLQLAIGDFSLPLVGVLAGGKLWIARCADPACTSPPAFDASIEDVEGWFSLVDDSTPGPAIARSKGGTLGVVRCSPTCKDLPWGVQYVNTISASGAYAVIARPPGGGSPLVAFQDAGLRVAQCGSDTCASDTTLSVIDDRTSLRELSVAYGHDGRPVIAYYDSLTRDVYVARCGSATCQDDTAVRAVGQSGEPLAVVTAFAEARIDLVDTVSRLVVSEIPVDAGPTGVAFSRDGKRAFVTSLARNTLSWIDMKERRVVSIMDLWDGAQPRGIAASPDGNRLYVANSGTNEVAVIDTTTGGILARIPVGSQPYGLALTPDGSTVVTANTTGNSASFVSTVTNSLLATVPVGQQPYGVVIDATRHVAYVANFGSNSVSVLDTNSRTVVGTIPVGAGPFGVAVKRDGFRLYVSDNQDNVSVVSGATRSVIATIPVGSHPQGLALTPDGAQLYVANQSSDSVTVIDTWTNTASVETIAVGSQPVSLGAFISPPFDALYALEYFHPAFGHYFVTSIPAEIQALDDGAFAGWERTGEHLVVFAPGSGDAEVCRFFTVAFAPKSSHFYTPLAHECEIVKTNPDWIYEGLVFDVHPPFGTTCPFGTTPLYRLYNNGMGGAPNHRYTTKTSIRDQMVAQGFVFEGAIGCVPK